ncbi:MAG: hypothetical protein K8U57_08490 [Planctomycetes bacterium]|nr:hypothetical protein [Planctomycetota bacterium]
MSVWAMLLACLAAGLFGVLFGLTLRERGSLSLGGSFEFVDAVEEFADGLFEPRIAFTQLRIFEREFLIRWRVHVNLNSDNPSRLNEIVVKLRVTGQGTLNKR